MAMRTLGFISMKQRELLSNETIKNFVNRNDPLLNQSLQNISNFHGDRDMDTSLLDMGFMLLALLSVFLFCISDIFLISYCIVYSQRKASRRAMDTTVELQVPISSGRILSTLVSVRSRNNLQRLPQDWVPHHRDVESNLSSSIFVPGQEPVETTQSNANFSHPFEEAWSNIKVVLARSAIEVQNLLWAENQVASITLPQNEEPQTQMMELQLCEEALKATKFVEITPGSNFPSSSHSNDGATAKLCPTSGHEGQSSSSNSGPDVESVVLECYKFDGVEPTTSSSVP